MIEQRRYETLRESDVVSVLGKAPVHIPQKHANRNTPSLERCEKSVVKKRISREVVAVGEQGWRRARLEIAEVENLAVIEPSAQIVQLDPARFGITRNKGNVIPDGGESLGHMSRPKVGRADARAFE
jgi:hypothetical protein